MVREPPNLKRWVQGATLHAKCVLGLEMTGWAAAAIAVSTLFACSPLSRTAGAQGNRELAHTADSGVAEERPPAVWMPQKPMIPPRVAMLAGLLPLRTLGIDTFRSNFPELDGRGVLIAILDNGIDPAVPGLVHTPTGAPKILDLRDFSGEGRIELQQMAEIHGDTATIAGQTLTGLLHLSRVAMPPYFAGVFKERSLGSSVAADVNGNGRTSDEFPVVAVRLRDGWAVVTDTDADGSFDGEAFIHDYGVARETFGYANSPGVTGPTPLSIAVNLGQSGSEPVVDFVFDNSGHGTHVAGIAAGHQLFGVAGFDGVAPGAQLLGLKIANNLRGGITVGGSVLKAMEYAVEFAESRDLSLVINMSHGIGNETEGSALIDSVINDFIFSQPNVVFVVSAGNEGPGLSSIGLPGSAQQALSVCALSPAVFAHGTGPGVVDEVTVVAPWSARGGELAKPDLCAPGRAFSSVPAWHSGKEVLEGTSQAAPQIAGAAAILISSVRARRGSVRAVEIARALKNTASRPPGTTVLDVGAGVPNLTAAYAWLLAGHQAGVYTVAALTDGGVAQPGPAAYRRAGLLSDGDTVQHFLVHSVGGQPAARLLLKPDVEWIRAPVAVEPRGGPVTIELTYDRELLRDPGLYVGTVTARSATDTAGGALFELVNTVVVPQGLSPKGYRHKLKRGATHRHFFAVPESAGGLEVAVALADPSAKATLYLFEPDGHPFRGRAERIVGGHRSSSVSINAGADELVPGVYEAVVFAPETEEIAYGLEVAVPDVSVESIEDGPSATVRNLGNNAVRAIVSAGLIGAVAQMYVEGVGSTSQSARLTPPQWANRVVLEVSLPKDVWNRITGFGVTVYDSTGSRVSDGPLIYSGARQVVDLSALKRLGDLTVVLLPAFARGDDRTHWSAALEVTYLLPDVLGLKFPDGSARTGVVLEPAGAKRVFFDMTHIWRETRVDLQPLVEVEARLPVGPPSIRRGAALPGESDR